ncbi:MAG: hypothetical protein ABJD02_17990 [Paraglaciecola sp.]|uniref:hypothetical protein n=1 Tax=Paraglaciecola sp. TaxID=1920173 RepID=UPI0032646278
MLIALTLLGFAIKIAEPESIILALVGLIFLYLFFDAVNDGLEISIMYKNISWYRKYCNATYISGGLTGFLIPFDSTQLISLLIALPALINAALIWPQITVNTYKKNYTKLFGLVDA